VGRIANRRENGAMPMGQTELICQLAFVEWTDAGHLRHCTFVAMRDDKKPAEVVRETLI
jgi:ATP-dependent DNA ligase